MVGWLVLFAFKAEFWLGFFLSMSYHRFCLNLNCDCLEDMSQKRHISLLKEKKIKYLVLGWCFSYAEYTITYKAVS